MHSHTVSKPPLSVCVSVCVCVFVCVCVSVCACLKAVFSERPSEMFLQYDARTLPICLPPRSLSSQIFSSLQTPDQPVWKLWGAEQDGEEVFESLEVGELRERGGRQKKRAIWFPNSRKDDSQSDRQTESQTDRQRVRQTDRESDRQTDRQTESQTDRQSDSQTDRQTVNQTWTETQTAG